MNVPSPAPCHVNVAGVGKQSVWGLRIIAYISVFTLTSFQESVKTQKWGAGQGVKPRFAASNASMLFDYTTHPLELAPGIPNRIS